MFDQVVSGPIPIKEYKTPNRVIRSYVTDTDENMDLSTVESFGEEWQSFHEFTDKDIQIHGQDFFDIVTDEMVNENTLLGDFGCGSGRFIKYFQHKAGRIIGIDPSKAIFSADKLVGKDDNVELSHASISNIPYPDEYFDFVMSVGVLHHIPDTFQAMKDCVSKVKKGGYFLTYIYYNFDNRGPIFRFVHKLSSGIRFFVSKMPSKLKKITCDVLAVILYMPFVLLSRALRKMNFSESLIDKIPLSPYAHKSFFVIRNDALDRFGTPLEHRFSKKQIFDMMTACGLSDIVFSPNVSYWHAVGKKI